VGIISEGDLIMRQAPTERRPWWHFFLLSDEQLAREFQKRAGTTVGEVMTRPVISVSPDLDLATAAALLHHHQIRRLPVLAGRRVIGVVSRHDIVKAMAEAPSGPRARQPDAALVAAMRVNLEREPWVTNRDMSVEANDGVLLLQGCVASEAERAALETMARAIAGCQGVANRLSVLPSSPG
jgi:CBS-domain-containing membrane protein